MQLKDSELLARLIYRAFIGPAEPGDSENMITFPMALALHARVAARENGPFIDPAGGGWGGPGIVLTGYADHTGKQHLVGAKPGPAIQNLQGGKTTEEKREIYARLMAFVAANGLGARRRIAEASGGKLTLDVVQDMTDAKNVDIKLWREANAAMTIIEETEDMEENVK